MKTEKLTYERYKCSDNIITIDLHNDYTVRADKMWNRKEELYEVEFMIKENTVDRWEPIETDNRITYKTNYKNINSAILRDVATRLGTGFFKPYIDSYKYEMYCFEKGNEMVEAERIKNVL